MREHPEYKYRPRRKPKPLVKKDGTSKYGFPLPFFPPGIDPILAARSFAFSPHYAAALAAASAFGSHSFSANSVLSTNEILNPFSALPVGPTHVPSAVHSNTAPRLTGESEPTAMFKNKILGTSETPNLFNMYPQNTALGSQEGFLAFVQKYHEEQNEILSNSQKANLILNPTLTKTKEAASVDKEHQTQLLGKEREETKDTGDNENDDDSVDEESEEDEFLDVDGNEARHQNYCDSESKKISPRTNRALTIG
jgi:hypothetical protein